MKKKKLLINTPLTDNCILDITECVKQWNDMYHISVWKNETKENYTFLNGNKRIVSLIRVQISKSQAMELVEKLCLKEIQSPIYNSGSSYHTLSFIENETKRLKDLFLEKEMELLYLQKVIGIYEKVV